MLLSLSRAQKNYYTIDKTRIYTSFCAITVRLSLSESLQRSAEWHDGAAYSGVKSLAEVQMYGLTTRRQTIVPAPR
jgi:hypothetical protein